MDEIEKLPTMVKLNAFFSSINTHAPISLQIVNANDNVTNQNEIDAWKTRDVLARTYLFSTIERVQQSILYGCNIANDMWTRLYTQHLQNSAKHRHLLMQQFFENKYQPDNIIMAHIAAIKLMVTRLNNLHDPVTYNQVMTKILVTLPPSYRHFLSVWDNVSVNEKNINFLLNV